MFLGEFQHSLDEKGRIILPAKFREQLSEGAFVTSEVDGCLAIWEARHFQTRAAEMQERHRGTESERAVTRAFFAGATDVVPDRQGRVALPQALREFAGLEREVAVTGQYDHIEIWNIETWAHTRRSGEQGLAAGAGA